MKLIIESGSTKTSWAFFTSNEVIFSKSAGWNPSTRMNEKLPIDENISKHLLSAVQETHYYGAGVRDHATQLYVKEQLKEIGLQGQIFIQSDILAVARACCGKESGWIAILGTGSNVGYFDGQQVTHPIPSLGYVLGDEGSGFHIGKEILRQYFSRIMPNSSREKFDNHFNLNVEDVLENTYRSGNKNGFVASFAPFLTLENTVWARDLVSKIFHEFFVYKIAPLPIPSGEKIHFCGSIAHHFKDILKNVAATFELQIGEIKEAPMEKLIGYHRQENIDSM